MLGTSRGERIQYGFGSGGSQVPEGERRECGIHVAAKDESAEPGKGGTKSGAQ